MTYKSWRIVLAVLSTCACGRTREQADAVPGHELDAHPEERVDGLQPYDAAESADIMADGQVEDGLDQGGPEIELPPPYLPFEFGRDDEGEPLTDQERQAGTLKLVDFYSTVNFFRWVIWTNHGMDASTGKPDYMIWWHDVDAVKKGDKVTFKHSTSGGGHNVMIPTSKVLASAVGAYLGTSDPWAAKVVEQFCKGTTATMKGMVYDENDPNPHIMSRNFVAQNHEYVVDGRRKAVDYSQWYSAYKSWNAQRFEYRHNPYWGDVWVTNMRSKDDVCHIFRTAVWLHYVVERGKDAAVVDACSETLKYLEGFARDIVDSGYYIRTKDEDGHVYVVTDQDLASFVWYVDLDPKNECPARVASDLLAYSKDLQTDCGTGFGSLYDQVAPITHYYNYGIINNFHMAAEGLALAKGDMDTAFEMLVGLAQRAHHYMHPPPEEPGPKDENWDPDLAVFLLQAASLGLPLTSREARLVWDRFVASAQEYGKFPRWDLWDESVPDGSYNHWEGYRPKREPGLVRIEEMALPFEYCFSPLKNPSGSVPFDCDILLNKEEWQSHR